jgi:glycerol-3-phosphate dehydrogenase (NAD(P)+)
MAKGIDRESGLTSFQVLHCMFPNNPAVMLSGPSIANEFALGLPTVVVLAGQNRNDLLAVSHLLDSQTFRTRFSEDEIGVELGGVLKNIYAIGLGMFDGQGIQSVNFRAAYLTIAVEEMARIGVGLGAKLETFLYLSGMGDLLATSMSEHSHNRKMGELLARGLTLEQIRNEMGVVPEGYNTLRSMLYLAEKLHISLPLAKGLWEVAHGRISPGNFINYFIRDFIN